MALQEVRHDAERDSQPQSLALLLRQYPFFVFQPASTAVGLPFFRAGLGGILPSFPLDNSVLPGKGPAFLPTRTSDLSLLTNTGSCI